AGAAEERGVEPLPAQPAVVEAEPALLASVIVMDLKATGMPKDQVEVLNDLLGESVARHERLKVFTASDVRRIADLESARSIMGCDQNACMAELANAMGARYVLVGSV